MLGERGGRDGKDSTFVGGEMEVKVCCYACATALQVSFTSRKDWFINVLCHLDDSFKRERRRCAHCQGATG